MLKARLGRGRPIFRLPLEEQRQLAEQLPSIATLSNEAHLAKEAEWLAIVEGTCGTLKGLDREMPPTYR